MTLTAGTAIGPYRILEQVGRGGMATVYKAHHAALARNVAIKVLPMHLADDAVFRERFRAEAVTIAKLRHPNILAIYDYGNENGLYYIVTEFVDGGTLADQLGKPLPVDYVARMLGPVASALDYAHARDVVHRDVKPSNVLVARDGNVIVSDFGLARMLEGSLPRLTQTGALVGTPEYMAPEQAAGESSGPAADRYALAVVAYEMLVGTVPFSADTPLATLLAHLHKPLPLPRERNPQLSTAIEEVLLRGLAKDPKDRYGTAADLVKAIDAAARQPSSPAASIPTAPPLPQQQAAAPRAATAPSATAPATAPGAPPSSRRRLLLAGLILVGLLIVAAVVQYVLNPPEDEGPALYADATLAEDTVQVTVPGETPNTIGVLISYGNGREAVLTDVVVILRPMSGAMVCCGAEETPEGLLFRVGDLGPYASGELELEIYFTATGSRIVQPTIRSNEVPAHRGDAQTVNVVPARP
jgi:tRNA A-37 threonylcarbamoyl transferase component Bud32